MDQQPVMQTSLNDAHDEMHFSCLAIVYCSSHVLQQKTLLVTQKKQQHYGVLMFRLCYRNNPKGIIKTLTTYFHSNDHTF